MGKKVLKIVLKVFKVLLCCIIVLFVALILLQRFSNSTFSFAGYRVFAVVTGSMEPVYSVGDVLLCKSTDTDKLKEGDDITYLGKEGSFKDKVVTHRIVKIAEYDGKKLYFTKGVANNSSDPPIEASQIYGKVSRKLVFLSFIHGYTSKGIGFFLFVILPIMILVGSEIVQTMLEKKAKLVGAQQGSVNQQVPTQNVNVNPQQNGVTAEQLQEQLASLQQQLVQQQQLQQQQSLNAQGQVNELQSLQNVNVQPNVNTTVNQQSIDPNANVVANQQANIDNVSNVQPVNQQNVVQPQVPINNDQNNVQ